jgi:hypothetical protein
MIDYFKHGNKRWILIKAGHMLIKSFSGKIFHHRFCYFLHQRGVRVKFLAKICVVLEMTKN